MNLKEYSFESDERNMLVFDINRENITVEINKVKNQNLLLKQLIAQMRHENQMLKKKLFSAGKTEIVNNRCA